MTHNKDVVVSADNTKKHQGHAMSEMLMYIVDDIVLVKSTFGTLENLISVSLLSVLDEISR